VELFLHDLRLLPLLPTRVCSSWLTSFVGIFAVGVDHNPHNWPVEPQPGAIFVGVSTLHGELALRMVRGPQEGARQAPEAEDHRGSLCCRESWMEKICSFPTHNSFYHLPSLIQNVSFPIGNLLEIYWKSIGNLLP